MGRHFLFVFVFVGVLASSMASANEMQFLDLNKGTGYLVQNESLIPISSRVDAFGYVRWFKTESVIGSASPTIKKIDNRTFEAEMNSGIVYTYHEDFGTIYYYHAIFKISQDRKTVVETSKFQAFSVGSEAPLNFESWKKLPFRDYKTYTFKTQN